MVYVILLAFLVEMFMDECFDENKQRSEWNSVYDQFEQTAFSYAGQGRGGLVQVYFVQQYS